MVARKPVTYTIEVKEFFFEDKRKSAKAGKSVLSRSEVRKMFLRDYNVWDSQSGDYRIVAKVSKEKPTVFTISTIPLIAQSCWNNPSGKCEMWYKATPDVHYDDGTVERPYKRTDDPAMNETQILCWLSARMGPDLAKFALRELLTTPAKKVKAEAA